MCVRVCVCCVCVCGGGGGADLLVGYLFIITLDIVIYLFLTYSVPGV